MGARVGPAVGSVGATVGEKVGEKVGGVVGEAVAGTWPGRAYVLALQESQESAQGEWSMMHAMYIASQKMTSGGGIFASWDQ